MSVHSFNASKGKEKNINLYKWSESDGLYHFAKEQHELLNGEMTRRVENKPNEMMKTVRHDEMGSMSERIAHENLHSPHDDMVEER